MISLHRLRSISRTRPTQTKRRSVSAAAVNIGVVVAVMSGLLSPAPAQASALPTTDTVNLQNLVTGLCADLPDTGAAHPQAPVTQYDCRYTPNDNQRWHLERQGRSHGRPAYLIKNMLGGCMDLPDFDKVNAGTAVSIYDCRPQDDNQLFVALSTNFAGVFKFAHALNHDLCLDVGHYRAGGNDARLTLWPCSDADDHLWLLRRSASDRTGASFGIVTTRGAALVLRAEPRSDSPRRGALANHTVFQIQCISGSRDDQWYRTASGRYTAARYVEHRGPAVPTCGGGPAEDLAKAFEQAEDYVDADAVWAILGVGRQRGQEWRDAYGKALKRIAQKKALEAAHISEEQVSNWRPEDGLVVKDERTDVTAQEVYDYYGWLFGQRRELLWAGMGKLAGATVYAGMQDAEYCWCDGGKDVSRKLLAMQKAIFDDLAWQHQLYVDRGLAALEKVNDAGLLGDAGARNAEWVDNGSTMLISAWRDIASGDQQRINRGNRVLIAREQDPVLQPYYDGLSVTHKTWMTGTSRFARSPIPPGQNKFWDTKPNGYKYIKVHGIPVRMPRSYRDRKHTLTIAWWEDRQKWVYWHLLPDYLARLEGNYPDLRHQIVDRPVRDRANDYREASQKKLIGHLPRIGLVL